MWGERISGGRGEARRVGRRVWRVRRAGLWIGLAFFCCEVVELGEERAYSSQASEYAHRVVGDLGVV